MKIALIGCGSKKTIIPGKKLYLPEELYTGSFFRLKMQYAKKYCDVIYILSAKYGVISTLDKIENYNLNLGKCSKEYQSDWAGMVAYKLSFILVTDTVVFLCSKVYWGGISEGVNGKKEYPLEGIGGIGKQMKFLFNQIHENDIPTLF